MSNVQFDQENQSFTSRQILGRDVVPVMARFLQNSGVVSTGQQARYVLIGLVVVAFIASGVILFFFTGPRKSPLEGKLIIPAGGETMPVTSN